MKKLALLLLILPFAWRLAAQKIAFRVIMDDKPIGEIQAEKMEKGAYLQYHLTSSLETTLMFKIQVTTSTVNEYDKGVLQKATATRTSNIPGESRETITALTGTRYAIQRNGAAAQLPAPILFCVSDLYFREPLHITTVFSEIQGLNLPVADLGGHQYEITQPTGKKDIYTYVNGKLSKLETVIGLYKVQILSK